ncbi:subunit 10 of transcription initiation factor IID [Hamiltosporidium tvaerminnensis]|uniref:Subunit 10 of transcription initiation factor IID n=2 Tax=Hamiltosporidium TaxID=1176354 RepID=A0A4Q9KQ15_9MICR|nr:Transcription initiation factor TFIID subunit 10 [Hamiltosporidium tvaerminnensis]TBT96713.1 subunit 10 of transcription initiation factor IID [Hamiltosporidium magnivora]TBT97496.1 subunit 10 of transcription initiation factor IID [Hamiltosporidium magnivora]TBT99907.1 subunit 10 of transcription initiation factor IID [Hamiltosporidium magnivora]TBU20984.1 subunit 10 of transcription initiation factor IID [Hamiltosporidium tvaerminnensis]
MDDESFNKFKENLEEFTPLIPDVVIDHFLERSGIEHCDENVRKMISLMTQKFITDISTSSFQYHKINQKAASKDKRIPKEKKPTLQVADLEKALEEQGINISRPYYFM